MSVKMINVQSSHLTAIGWEEQTLHIHYANGKKYAFDNVPESVFNEMLSSPSTGKFYHNNIKGQYPSRQV